MLQNQPNSFKSKIQKEKNSFFSGVIFSNHSTRLRTLENFNNTKRINFWQFKVWGWTSLSPSGGGNPGFAFQRFLNEWSDAGAVVVSGRGKVTSSGEKAKFFRGVFCSARSVEKQNKFDSRLKVDSRLWTALIGKLFWVLQRVSRCSFIASLGQLKWLLLIWLIRKKVLSNLIFLL